MRVINLNLNGIRAAAKKGFFDWMILQNADFVCLQETRSDLKNDTTETFHPPGYSLYCHDAEKKGYSGVAIYSKHKPQKIITGLGWQSADQEGRYVELQFDSFNIASLYLPSGTSGAERQAIKYDFMQRYFEVLQKIKKSTKNFIITGDINIAHKQIDIKNWRTNQKHSGFLPEERAWLDKVIDELGFVDTFRVLNQKPDQYTWWSNFAHARDRNVGWRIDYQIVTSNLKDKIQAVSIYNEKRFSDHAPLIIDYGIKL